MEFQKYKERGAYHWLEHKKQTTYGKHADYLASLVKKGKTLDIGAGDGLITYLIGAEGIDDNELAVKLAQEKGVDVKVGDAYDLNYPNDTFDNVVLADVIEHIESPEVVMGEIKRVLKKDGIVYITTPPKRSDGTMHDKKYHYKEYSPTELKDFVEKFGFKINGPIISKFVRMYAVFSNK